MENKQTAVEWLIEQIERGKIKIVYSDKIHSIKCITEISNQALAMEKEQITDSYTMGSYDMADKEFRPEQYYNETYGTHKQTLPGEEGHS